MSEDPFPNNGTQLTPSAQVALLRIVRRNVINVFTHLSKAHSAKTERSPLFILHLRSNAYQRKDGTSDTAEKFVTENGPSLLFYYLFDDWYSTYGLITRKEQRYSAVLNELVRDSQFRYAVSHHHPSSSSAPCY